MENWYAKFLYETQHVRELRQEAVQYRLIKEAEAANRMPRFYWRWLYRLGVWMSHLGCRIEFRYLRMLDALAGKIVDPAMVSRCA